jgi:DNA-binding transcriptional LysR family regulator
MNEEIDMRLQVAAVALADALNYTAAADDLDMTRSELIRRIGLLENQLDLKIFRAAGDIVSVTPEGNVLINACRAYLSRRSGRETSSKPC